MTELTIFPAYVEGDEDIKFYMKRLSKHQKYVKTLTEEEKEQLDVLTIQHLSKRIIDKCIEAQTEVLKEGSDKYD
jgi:hypothetical protein